MLHSCFTQGLIFNQSESLFAVNTTHSLSLFMQFNKIYYQFLAFTLEKVFEYDLPPACLILAYLRFAIWFKFVYLVVDSI